MSSDSQDILDGVGLDTLAIRAGQHRTEEGEHSDPIFMTSSYVFDSAAHAAARFSGDEPGNVYSRYTNPTIRSFEERIAALEGAEAGVATASGMAAILSTCMALLAAGDHVICSKSVFGTTTVLFGKYLEKFGVSVTLVSLTDIPAWEQAINDKTKLLFLETPSNPINDVANISWLADLAHAHSCLLVVDNCFCTPALQTPIALGADIVVHSATKYLDGQGRCLGGAVVGRSEHMLEILAFIRTCGPSMSPFNAWVFLKGLETLRIRMEAHSRNALTLATWLESHTSVERVFYCGLASNAGHELAKKQQSGFGGVLSFRVKGGRNEAWRVLDSARILSLTANLGDVKTTIVHPATTTHSRLSDEAKLEAGITENLIRVAVGLESIDDIQKDLDAGLSKI